ncbi:hypothetical protein MUN88_09060 [Gracilibacillus caseinilyticus]|uniref:Uncharacterized protein n=1 Tax=Gracilibacillus caseinilyticus TaxID=2932256 RepID=A0ABY4F0J2_9BACI|nr:hypothetical protein [Gracilibacillus caseinilyticus]UOQ50183.1 hypothetical protein MUN88_09060 [Gracilibacillus caseinilyticus]
MYWETLPNWFWTIYYIFLLATLGTAIFRFFNKHDKILSIVCIIFTLTIPIVSFFYSFGRARGMNEFEHLLNQFFQGAVWSIFTLIGYLFLLIWWSLFLFKKKSYGSD